MSNQALWLIICFLREPGLHQLLFAMVIVIPPPHVYSALASEPVSGGNTQGVSLGRTSCLSSSFLFCVCLMPSACFPRSLLTPHTLIPASESVQACGAFWIYCWQCKTITRVNFWISSTKILVCKSDSFQVCAAALWNLPWPVNNAGTPLWGGWNCEWNQISKLNDVIKAFFFFFFKF